ncbi:hypothetical protein G3580_07740 [Nitrogeniibacter mangrovi]|uniref:Uncharacterized protein n=1 Tax=Nitrogeniibacter mangrovi TaxID=2016596 RepID=A0A6C1B2D9_9RHOO|nr:hypothetical protein [Nitrogeniibacter mangrovi]QID17543.1 hypothetical protein G3580_07740 [Nitrogeniibacter mangrovi]
MNHHPPATQSANPAAARFTLLDPAPVTVACGFALTALLAFALRTLG